MTDRKRKLSAKEIAAQHAVSERTVRRLADTGQLPADRIGRVYRFDPCEVAKAIQLSRGGRDGNR